MGVSIVISRLNLLPFCPRAPLCSARLINTTSIHISLMAIAIYLSLPSPLLNPSTPIDDHIIPHRTLQLRSFNSRTKHKTHTTLLYSNCPSSCQPLKEVGVVVQGFAVAVVGVANEAGDDAEFGGFKTQRGTRGCYVFAG